MITLSPYLVTPSLHPHASETPKREAWRNCSAMACACPQTLKDRVQERLGGWRAYGARGSGAVGWGRRLLMAAERQRYGRWGKAHTPFLCARRQACYLSLDLDLDLISSLFWVL